MGEVNDWYPKHGQNSSIQGNEKYKTEGPRVRALFPLTINAIAHLIDTANNATTHLIEPVLLLES